MTAPCSSLSAPYWRAASRSRWSATACASRASCSSSLSAWRWAPTASASSTSTTTGWPRAVGIVALAAILFEGGLAAGFPEIRPVLRPALALAIVGTTLTAVFAGLAASWLLDLTLLEGLLLGSILAATDGAAIFAILRGSTLRRRVARTLEGEAGLNDPVAVLFVIGFSAWITTEGYGLSDMVLEFVIELSVGAVAGLAVGAAGVWLLRRTSLSGGGMYPVASMALAAMAFGAGDMLHGSGFLSVYLAGLVLGSAPLAEREAMATFHDGLAWVAQLVMFLTLGLLVFPDALGRSRRGHRPGAGPAWSRGRSRRVRGDGRRLRLGERAVLGWAGLRGACRSCWRPSRCSRASRAARVLRHRLLRRAGFDRPAGHNVRGAGPTARGDHRPSRPPRGQTPQSALTSREPWTIPPRWALRRAI